MDVLKITPDMAAAIIGKHSQFIRIGLQRGLLTYHGEPIGTGKLIGRVFAIENAGNEVIAERFFKMFNILPHEFTHVRKNKAFVIDGKHIVAPFNVYRTLKVVCMKMDGVADEEN